MGTITTLTIFLWLLMGFSSAYFASQRGRNPYIWFVIGLLFGALGLIFLFLLPVITNDSSDEMESDVDKEMFELTPSNKNHEFLVKDWFYLDIEHKQQGPISFDTLKTMLAEGNIQRSSYVWSEGMVDWKKIEEFGELKDVLEE